MTLDQSPSRKRLVIAQIVAYAAAWGVIGPVAYQRLFGAGLAGNDVLGWPSSYYWSAPLYLPLLLLAPFCWWFRRPLFVLRRASKSGPRAPFWSADVSRAGWSGTRAWMLAICCGAVSLAMSVTVSREFDDLPPAYHDEYSYLFQAKTFLAGKVSYSSHEAADLFNQVHVLNEGRFASRYFPGAGMWMAPFVALGNPYWGHWLAGAITAFFVFWSGRELGGDGVGLVAGGLTALSPGMALFSNMLLAHHPTLVGLSLFLFSFLRWRNRRTVGYALLAGIGLTFAMYCRPMTAAGFALPFGIVFARWWVLGNKDEHDRAWRVRCQHAFALGGPILVGLVAMFPYNRAITGNGFTTPYQLYTDVYTPRHVYGFNNVKRGEQKLGPKVIDNYDRWAENLTPQLALRNVAQRTVASAKWTLGIVPLLMAVLMFLIITPRTESNRWLVFWSIVSLHAAHIPYWYVGIMHWHYVFESGILLCLIFGLTTADMMRFWVREDRPWMPWWWAAMTLAAVVMMYGSFDPFWEPTIQSEVNIIRYPRKKHEAFEKLVNQFAQPRPAIVFVEHDPADLHIDYVINSPDLSDEILTAHYLPEKYSTEDLRRLFPNRSLFLFRAKTREFRPLE